MTLLEESQISLGGDGATSQMAVLLFSDIVGSTAIKDRLGTAAYARLLAQHNRLFESLIEAADGARIIKHTGDGYMATFSTASSAVGFAVAFQEAMRTARWEPEPIATRCGIHLGQMIYMTMAGKLDVVGMVADLAARLMSLAVGGQILLTREVFNDARQFMPDAPANLAAQEIAGNATTLRWMAHGRYLFKGADEAMEIFEVGRSGVSPLRPPPDGEKARRAISPEEEETLGWRPAMGLEVPGRPAWVIQKKLGAGGFGEVWLGKHRKLSQLRVFKFCFDADRLRSFKREMTLFRVIRDVLGERDDIARLHEVKLDRAPYFLESDYSKSGDLNGWAESIGGIDKLPLVTRLDLVARAAEAVAAAHSVGVIHKDIKPSNVLVNLLPDGTPRPVLADFGIGILADRTRLAELKITQAGFTNSLLTDNDSSRTGTRLYAPPETLAGKAFTTAGDVYALGVLLYQMTVGDLHRPLGEGWQQEVDDELLREDIAAAVRADPTKRLAGAAELAERLKTLEARRAARLEAARAAEAAKASEEEAKRLKEAARRRSKLLKVAVVMIVFLVGVVAVIGVLARKLQEQKIVAQSNFEKAELQRQQAEKARQEANEAMAAFQVVITPVRSDYKMTILDAVKHADAVVDEKDYSSAVKQRVRVVLGGALYNLGQYEEAEKVMRHVWQTRSADRSQGTLPEDLLDADVYETLADALLATDSHANWNEINGLFTQALAIRRRLQPDSHELKSLELNYSGILTYNGSVTDGETAFFEAMRPFMDNRSPSEVKAYIYSVLAQAKYDAKQGHLDQAMDLIIQSSQTPLHDPKARWETPDSLNEMGQYVLSRGDVLGCEVFGRVAVKLSEEINGKDDPRYAKELNALGLTLARCEHHDEGIKLLQQASDIAERRLGPASSAAIEYSLSLIEGLDAFDRYDDSAAVRRKLLSSAAAQPQPQQARATMLGHFAASVAAYEQPKPRQLDQALRDVNEAVELGRAAYAPGDHQLEDLLFINERVLRRRQQFGEAEKVCRELLQSIKPTDEYVLAKARSCLGQDLNGQHRHAEAVSILNDGYNGLLSAGGHSDEIVEAALALAEAQSVAGSLDASAAAYRTYLDECRKSYGNDHRRTLEAQRRVAAVFLKHPATADEGQKLLTSARDIAVRSLDPQDAVLAAIVQDADRSGIAPATQPAAGVPETQLRKRI